MTRQHYPGGYPLHGAVVAGEKATLPATPKIPIYRMIPRVSSSMLGVFRKYTDSAASSTSPLLAFIGDGSDGAVTVSTTITLTRDMNYTTLHVTSTGTINTAGYNIRAKTSITVDAGGTIKFDGASPVSPGSAAASAFTTASLSQGGPSKVGGTTTGTAGQGFSGSIGAGGAGGAGGAIGGTAGGAAGPAPAGIDATGTASGGARTVFSMTAGFCLGVSTTVFRPGASGGSGAGVDGSHLGGASGGGAGVVILSAPAATINGTISAKGGAGAVSPSATNGGGGGGGGGGVIVTNSVTAVAGSPTYDVSGGAGAAGAGTGASGSNGSAGTVINNVWA